jgi:hypothetical protein
VADLERAYYLFGFDPVQGAANSAAALGAIGSAAEDAGFDATFEVGGIIGGHFREQAIVGILGRAEERFAHAFREQEFGKLLVHDGEFASEDFAVFRQELLGALFSDLGRVDADPNAIHFGPGAPERDVLLEIAGAFEHRARYDPVNVDFAAFDIFQDAFVGGGLTADVVVFGQAVNRDGDADTRELHPLDGNGNHGAGDDERENTHAAQNRENAAEFLVTDERFAAYKRNVNGLVFADEIDYAVDESVAAKIVELSKSGFTAEVRVAIGITAGTGKRAFASDFDGKHGDFTGEDIPPGRENFTLREAWVRSTEGHRPSL